MREEITINVTIDHITIEAAPDLTERLDEIKALLIAVKQTGEETMQEIDQLEVDVAEISTVTDSAVTLLGNLAQLLRDAQADPARIVALSEALDARKDALAAAIEANTPAAPV